MEILASPSREHQGSVGGKSCICIQETTLVWNNFSPPHHFNYVFTDAVHKHSSDLSSQGNYFLCWFSDIFCEAKSQIT